MFSFFLLQDFVDFEINCLAAIMFAKVAQTLFQHMHFSGKQKLKPFGSYDILKSGHICLGSMIS